MSPEAVEKNRLSHIGIRKTPETIAKIVAARAGYKHSMETRKKMSEWQIGRKMSPEAILKGVLARRGYRASAETKAKISAAGKGRPKSAATRAKMSASQKRRFAKSVAARALNKMEAQHAH